MDDARDKDIRSPAGVYFAIDDTIGQIDRRVSKLISWLLSSEIEETIMRRFVPSVR